MVRHDDDVVILSAVRTPIGKFQGSLSSITASRLGAIVIAESLRRAGADGLDVGEVLMGNVIQAGEGQAPARQASLGAGLSPQTGAVTINKVCGSGLKTLMLASALLRAGDGDIYVAGGMENMSLAPYLLPKARFGYRLGHGEVKDSAIHDGLWCAAENQHMGMAAEWIAAEYGVSRRDQDEYALESQRRAVAASDAGAFDEEIVAVPEAGSGHVAQPLTADETPRRDTSLEALAALKPVFVSGGTVTAGNSPGITDGAAAVVAARRAYAQAHGLRPLARVLGYCQRGVPPRELFVAPVLALEALATELGMHPADFDLLELNEAFAAQAVANIRSLGLQPDRVNVNGGSIALGHPIGASGARILTTLLHALRDRGRERGAAVLCLGGGEAVALAVELE
jgi:acetyl-CoA C-acetyltransferase